MKTVAAVAWEPNRPLVIEEIDVEGPKAGEVLVRMVATGVCHWNWWLPNWLARVLRVEASPLPPREPALRIG